jgi:hypothetical protein
MVLDEDAVMSAQDCEWSISGAALAELLQDVLRKGLPFTFRASGFSMSPFIKDGDDLTLFPLNGISPGLGDVVAFIHKGTGVPFIHRVVGMKENACLLQGDNATEADGLISESDILGCVRMVERRGLRVFFGLGPERFLIAYLNRRGILLPLIRMLRKLRLLARIREFLRTIPFPGRKGGSELSRDQRIFH